MSDPTTYHCDLCCDHLGDNPVEVDLPQIGKPFICGSFCEPCAKLIHDAYVAACEKKGIQP